MNPDTIDAEEPSAAWAARGMLNLSEWMQYRFRFEETGHDPLRAYRPPPIVAWPSVWPRTVACCGRISSVWDILVWSLNGYSCNDCICSLDVSSRCMMVELIPAFCIRIRGQQTRRQFLGVSKLPNIKLIINQLLLLEYERRIWRSLHTFLRTISICKVLGELSAGTLVRVGKHFSCFLLTGKVSNDSHVFFWRKSPHPCKWFDCGKVIVALQQKQFSLPLLSSRMDVFRVGRCTRPRLNKHRMITSSTQSQGCNDDPVDRVMRIGKKSSQQSISRPSVVGRVPSCIRQIQCTSERSSAFESNRCWRKSVANLQDLSS